MMIIFWGIIGYVIYLAFKGSDAADRPFKFQSAGSTAGSASSAEATLKSRYAKGEIDEETYLRMLRNMRG